MVIYAAELKGLAWLSPSRNFWRLDSFGKTQETSVCCRNIWQVGGWRDRCGTLRSEVCFRFGGSFCSAFSEVVCSKKFFEVSWGFFSKIGKKIIIKMSQSLQKWFANDDLVFREMPKSSKSEFACCFIHILVFLFILYLFFCYNAPLKWHLSESEVWHDSFHSIFSVKYRTAEAQCEALAPSRYHLIPTVLQLSRGQDTVHRRTQTQPILSVHSYISTL